MYYVLLLIPPLLRAGFHSPLWNENSQNVKCAGSFIPHSCSGTDRTPFHPFCSQVTVQNEQNVANENPRWRRDKHCRFKRAPTGPAGEKIRIHFWIQWNMATYFFVPMVLGVFQWCFLQEKGNLASDYRGHGEKWLLSIGNNLWEQMEVPNFFVPEVRTQQQHVCYAMFTRTRTAYLDGRFLRTQSELFRAFSTSHSYSRIVNKKTCSNTAGRHFGFERDYNYHAAFRACYVIMYKVYSDFSNFPVTWTNSRFPSFSQALLF